MVSSKVLVIFLVHIVIYFECHRFLDFVTFSYGLIFGSRKVLSLDDYASLFENIDPVSQYKTWTTKRVLDRNGVSVNMVPRYTASSERVKAVFIVSDPVDWGRDIQVFLLFW